MSSNETPKLRQMASEACEGTASIEEAIERLKDRVFNLPAKHPVRIEAIEWACREAVYDARHTEVRRLKFMPKPCPRTPEAYQAAAKAVMDSILDRTMPDGRRLGDHRGDELPAFAADCSAKAHGLLKDASFFGKLAQLAGERIVREVVTDQQARDLWNEIKPGEASAPLKANSQVPARPNNKHATAGVA